MSRGGGPYLLAAVGVIAAAVVFAIIFGVLPEEGRLDLLREIASAAIGFVPLAFFGVLIADMVKRRDAEEVRSDQRSEARSGFRRQAIEAYNATKQVRRQLRANGLRPDSGAVLTEDRLHALDQGLLALSGAQLTIERLSREASTAAWLGASRTVAETSLRTFEKDLNRVVREWEAGRPRLRVGDEASVFGTWAHYSAFVAERDAVARDKDTGAGFRSFEELMLEASDA